MKANKNFYGFTPKYVPETELHLYVANLMMSLIGKGLNEKNKSSFVNLLTNMMEEKKADNLYDEYEVIKATIYSIENGDKM